MSAEYTWEQLVADHERDVSFQDKYLLIPTFDAKVLVEETLPILRKGQEVLQSEKLPRTGIRTNISQIEIVYPFLLQKAGLLKDDLPTWAVTGEVQEERIIGEELHKADAIFSIVVQGIKDPRLMQSYLPEYSDEEIDRISYAVSDVSISPNASQQQIYDALFIAWGRYRNIITKKEDLAIPLPGMGFVDPLAEERFRKSLEIDKRVDVLIEAWTKELTRLKPATWEFEIHGKEDEEEVVNQREIMAIVKFVGPNLQFVSRLDSVARKRKKSEKVKSQHVDFKTGNNAASSTLDAEVKKRQSQVMRNITERFTSKYMTNFRSLVPRDKAFVMRARHDSKAFDRVDICAYRYLDRDKKEFRVETVEFGEEERADYELWLSWYGSMMHYFRSDVKKLIRQNPGYKLPQISISEERLAEFYRDN